MAKLFLIHPVRGHDQEETEALVKSLERAAWEVYWPIRDTDQSDPVGLDICKANRAGIEAADIVAIVWDGVSTGSLFDLGMAFALRKPLRVMSIPPKTPHKSFQNMMREWQRKGLSEYSRDEPA